MNRYILDSKAVVMIEKIETLYLICNMLFSNSEAEEIKALEIMKKYYLQIYNKLIETKQYEKYKDVEDIMTTELAKIEINVDRYIYSTVQSYEEVIKSKMAIIHQSENYQNFSDLEQEIQHVETLKQVLKLYSPYISKNEIERLYDDIKVLKFNVLWRNQVQQLIYGNSKKKSTLMQYDDQEERKCFIEQLEKKMKSLTILGAASIKNDEILRVKSDTILKDNNLLERLIIIDMQKNPYDYINLVKAKVFNAHLCNIASNPFKPIKQKIYEGEYYALWRFFLPRRGEELKVSGGMNYSLLRAILKSVITDENISIMECENLYEKFGFNCRPILVNDGQKCVKMIYNIVKDSPKYKKIIEESKENKKSKEGKYCKIDFEGLLYYYDDDLIEQNPNDFYENDNNRKELLNQRKVKVDSKIKKILCKKRRDT